MQIVIIGSGPSSLMAATRLILKGHKITVFDQSRSLGRKFLVAGKGGFNLSHAGSLDYLVAHYASPHMKQIVSLFDNNRLVNWLNELGVPTYVGSSGKIFPEKTIKPYMVLSKWLTWLSNKGVDFLCNSKMVDFSLNQVIIQNTLSSETITIDYDRLILGLGGASWPKTGSDGTWKVLFEKKNIHVNPFSAFNVGVNLDMSHFGFEMYQGTILKNVIVSCGDCSKKGDVILTRFGMIGTPIYYCNANISKKETFFIDLKPDNTIEQLNCIFSTAKSSSIALKKLKIPDAIKSYCKSILSKEDYISPIKMAGFLKKLPIKAISLRNINEAISTVGGVSWDELNSNLSLRKFPNLFCVGEMLDWEAPTGGFLLQGAFSTGYYVGEKLF